MAKVVKMTDMQIFYENGVIAPTKKALEKMRNAGVKPSKEVLDMMRNSGVKPSPRVAKLLEFEQRERFEDVLRQIGLVNLKRENGFIEGEVAEWEKIDFLKSIDLRYLEDLKTKGRIYKRMWVRLRVPDGV